jgi:two-component system NarL family sensor kinase
MAWLQAWVWIPGIGSVLTFLLLLFPNGRLLTHRWRWIAWVSAISITLSCLMIAVGGWKYREVLLLKTPDQLPGIGLYYAISLVGLMLIVLCALASTFSLILRFRRATGEERQQLKWFTYTSVLLFLNILVGSLISGLQLVHIDATLPKAVNNTGHCGALPTLASSHPGHH